MGNINLDHSNCLNLEKLRAKISKVTFPIADKCCILHIIFDSYLTHFKLVIGFKMESTGRVWWGSEKAFKITFSLAKSICDSSLNIIANRLTVITTLMSHRENFKYTNVTYRLMMNDPNKHNCRLRTLI